MRITNLLINIAGIISTFYLKDQVSAKLCTASSKDKYLNPALYNSAGDFKPQLNFMADQSVAYWYTDRGTDMSGAKENLKNFIQQCDGEIPVIVVYGIPNKDCAGVESSSGFNSNSNFYETFIKNLKDTLIKDSIVILEPDATALSIDGNACGIAKGYKENLQKAINILSASSNIKLYLDVGHWVVIYGNDKIKKLTDFVSSIDNKNTLKGFSLNLSNYRKTEEMEKACRDIRSVSGKDYKCVIDTSRNNKGPSQKNTWCNFKNAGIGISGNDAGAPKSDIIDHYVWIKPAIELDGNCYGEDESYQSSKGAGSTDLEWLKILWNNGYYKNTQLLSNDNPTGNTNAPTGNTNAPVGQTTIPTNAFKINKVCKFR
jgi:hypothetical protein